MSDASETDCICRCQILNLDRQHLGDELAVFYLSTIQMMLSHILPLYK